MVAYPAQQFSEEAYREQLEPAEYLAKKEQLVESLNDVRIRDVKYKMLVKWEGWKVKDDYTWETFEQLQEDVPGLLADCLLSPKTNCQIQNPGNILLVSPHGPSCGAVTQIPKPYK